MKCFNCGKENKDGINYCAYCGVSLYDDRKNIKSGIKDLFKNKYIKVISIILAILIPAVTVVGVLAANGVFNNGNLLTGRIEFKDFTKDDIAFENNELFVKNQLLITADKKFSYSDVEKIVSEYKGKIVGSVEFTNDYQVEFEGKNFDYLITAKEMLKNELENSEVDFHKVFMLTDCEDKYSSAEKGGDWWRHAIALPALEAEKLNYSKVKVGIFDSLFDVQNEYLADNNITVLKNNQNLLSDDIDHGTQVMGFIGAQKKDGKGIEGVCRNADYYLYAYYRDGEHYYSSLMKYKYAIALLLSKGVKIINLSNGYEDLVVGAQIGIADAQSDLSYFQQAMSSFLKKQINAGIEFVIVKAAGNLNDDTWVRCKRDKNNKYGVKLYNKSENVSSKDVIKDVIYDAKYDIFGAITDAEVVKRIVMVGASTVENKPSAFSLRGSRIDIYAPGEALAGLSNNESGKQKVSGTSFSAPIVSGVIALMMGVNPNLKSDLVKSIIMSSAVQPIKGEYYESEKYFRDGKKFCVNAYQAVKFAQNLYQSEIKTPENNKALLVGTVITNLKDDEFNTCALADIVIKNEDDSIVKTISSDKKGNYEVELDPGTYTIQAENGNFAKSMPYNISLVKNEVRYLNICLEYDQITDILDKSSDDKESKTSDDKNTTEKTTTNKKENSGDNNNSDNNGKNTKSSNTQQEESSNELEFVYPNNEVDLGAAVEVTCKQNINFSEAKITTEGDHCFKITIAQNDTLHLGAVYFNEGTEKFTVVTPDGKKGSFSLSVVLRKRARDDIENYANTYVPYHSPDSENMITIDSINKEKVVFRIQQGSQNRPYIPHAEGEIYDGNKVDFETVDSIGNKYKGYMEFDMYSIYLRLEITEKSKFYDDNMVCDCRFLAVS